ncbi:MAG: DNA-directed RNA polymerase subunit alpha [Berkelbacteria bacterium GW2011_GWB1_38_5]|uniref:DNA-directed RNA polymerase subunit alpha n=2 Tax=Candidatus Berkelbacteria TaxID=1618330 RepID=A0A0G0LIQ2_9BACT|nr:MAG: DNA-directed RNA polymerase subunit alpha [Berkelbacteria bacterium GW2011_GWB1_38_5]KKQ90947.1 MAG: DNA-directed RNA polymerase subunit alpha [Berkelbacteria bacterium GW2011_GWA1_39_10]
MDYTLQETSLLQIKTLEKVDNRGTFQIEPLSPGYGVTIGNSLRRVLLSSLEGSAINSVKIEGITHQFMAIPGVKEDYIEIILNLKSLRFRFNSEEPAKLKLDIKGPKNVTAADFDKNAACEVVNTDAHIATLGKGAKLTMEIIVDKGRGYIPLEQRKDEKLPIGTIAIDSIYTPVKKVHYEVENTRVGGQTNFDKLTMEITTDGSLDPEKALGTAAQILVEHFSLVGQACQIAEEVKTPEKKLPKKSIKIAKAKKAKK